MKVSIDKDRVTGAIVVLENYLDGALADYENGDVENTSVLEDCIYIHRVLEVVLTDGIACIIKDEYQTRFDAKKNK